MKFKIIPEDEVHGDGGGRTVAYYLFGAETYDPHRDVYDQGFVIEVWEGTKLGPQLPIFGPSFYVLDGSDEKITKSWPSALNRAKIAMRHLGYEVVEDTEESLTKEIQTYLTEEGLPQESVDEVLARDDLTPFQRRVLTQFYLRWEALELT